MKVEIPRAKDCSVRIATLTIRYATLTIKPPTNSQLLPITVNTCLTHYRIFWVQTERARLEKGLLSQSLTI